MNNLSKHIYIILIGYFLLSLKLNASPQLPDYIIHEGDTSLCYNLLVENYLNNQNVKDKGKLFDLSFRNGASLNCWRGYQAIYTIEHNQIYLTDILECGELISEKFIDKRNSLARMKKIFGDKVKDNRVKINWYSGIISIPHGEPLRWDGILYKIHMHETLLTIKSGTITNIREVTNYIDEQRSINRIQKDTLSSILFNEILKQKWKSKFDCSERFNITINAKGIIDKVTMINYQTQSEIEEFWDMREYNYCIRKLIDSFKELKFDIIKDKGIPIEENIQLEIFFNDNGSIENWTY